MRAVIILLLLAVASIAGIFLLDYTGTLSSFFAIDEQGVRDILESQYPDSDPIINQTDNCTICSEEGCRDYGSPCWRVMVITGDNQSKQVTEMIMGTSGSIESSETRPCTGWWCGADPCDYIRTESQGDATMTYTNSDCGSSELSCDPYYERCRQCELGSECVAVIETSLDGSSTYRYEVLRTGEHAEISEAEGICRIYSRGSHIHQEPMSPEECGSLMRDNTACYDGTCDFVPGFDLIPG